MAAVFNFTRGGAGLPPDLLQRFEGKVSEASAAADVATAAQEVVEAARVAAEAAQGDASEAAQSASADRAASEAARDQAVAAASAAVSVQELASQATEAASAAEAAADLAAASGQFARATIAPAPVGAIIESGLWLGDAWTSASGAENPASLTPHAKDVSAGGPVLAPGETIWSRRDIYRATGSGPIDAELVIEISGLQPGETAAVDVPARRFNTYGGTASTVWVSRTGLTNGTNVLTVRYDDEKVGGFRRHRLGVKSPLTNSQNITFRVMSAAFKQVIDARVYSIFDFAPPTGIGEDAAAAFERAYAAIPPGEALAPTLLDLGGRTWYTSRTVPFGNYSGATNGNFSAIGTLASWTTTERATVESLRKVHDAPRSGWIDKTTRLRAVIEPRGYRIYLNNITIDCNDICNGIDDSRGNSLRITDVNINNYVVFGATYINGSGMRMERVFVQKFGHNDPRIGSDRLNTGFGVFTTQNDGGFSGVGGLGGDCVFYQYEGGTIGGNGGHPWNSGNGLSKVISGPRLAGEQVRVNTFMSDTTDAMVWDESLMTAAIGEDGFAIMTFKADWTPADGVTTTVWCTPVNRRIWRMHGWGSTWQSPYLDDGVVELKGTGHRVYTPTTLVNQGTRIKSDCLYYLIPTVASQSPEELVLGGKQPNVPKFAILGTNPDRPTASWAMAASVVEDSGVAFSKFGLAHWSKAASVANFYSGATDNRALIKVISNSGHLTYWGGYSGGAAILVGGASADDRVWFAGKGTGHTFWRYSGTGAVLTATGAPGTAGSFLDLNASLSDGSQKRVSVGATAAGALSIKTGGLERVSVDEAGQIYLSAAPTYTSEAAAAAAGVPVGATYSVNGSLRRMAAGGTRLTDAPRTSLPNIGVYVSGGWYDNALHGASSATVAGVAGHVVMSPMVVLRATSFNAVGIVTSTAVAGAQARCFIYDDDGGGLPGALLWVGQDTLDLGATGLAYHTLASNVTLQPGRNYWIGCWHSSTATVRAIPVSACANLGIDAPNGSSYRTAIRRTIDFATALPPTWGFSTADYANNITPPSVRMRVA